MIETKNAGSTWAQTFTVESHDPVVRIFSFQHRDVTEES